MNVHQVEWLLISNPVSGKGKSRAIRERVEHALDLRESSYFTIEEFSLEESLSATVSLLEIARPSRGIIILGGDGTIHQIMNSVVDSFPNIPIGVIPTGTGNDFSRQCGLQGLSIPNLIEIFSDSEPETIDVISVNDRFCLQVLSTGFDAQVSDRSSRLPSILGRLKYIFGLMVELIRLRPIDYQLVVDGEELKFPALMVACANGRNYGGGMMISPHSDHQDGRFEVVIIHPVTRLELLRVFPRIFNGSHIEHPAVEVIQASEVNLRAPTIAQGDGEPIADEGIPLMIRASHITSWKM